MADLSAADHRDLIENAKSRDQRLGLIEQSLDIEAELRDSPTWRYLRHRIELEKGDIAAELAETDPADLGAVAKLQARAIAMTSIPRWLGELIGAAGAAEYQIAAEDGRLPQET